MAKKILYITFGVLGMFLCYFAFSRYTVSKLDGRGTNAVEVIREERKPVSIIFVGDIMLDRTVRKAIDAKSLEYLLADVASIFDGRDLVVGNLEGTITSNPSLSVRNYSVLKFTFDPKATDSLKELGFSGFSLANNHTLDFGKDGFLETQANLSHAGLFSFGSPLNNLSLTHIETINNEIICFIGYHSLFDSDSSAVEEEIQKGETECTFTVVFAHWGTEYAQIENIRQRDAAHTFVDRGADLVIGAHPHVVEPVEIYNDKAIFYSLGNFIFDQDFSLATRQGLTVSLELSTSTVSYKLMPIEMRRAKLYFPDTQSIYSIMNIISSRLPDKAKNSLRSSSTIVLPR